MLSPIRPYVDPLSLREKLLNAFAAALAMLALGLLLRALPHEGIALPLMASMGASAFLLFVLPHSPMAQPWPLLGGHLLAGAIALLGGHLIDEPVLAVAASVGCAVLAMQLLGCLHPPAAATALAVALVEEPLSAELAQGIAYSVGGGALLLLLIAVTINRLLLRRRYPMRHSHHPHHEEFQQTHARDPLRLAEDDIDWALSQMDGIIAANREDLIDIFELALEHAEEKAGTSQARGNAPAGASTSARARRRARS